MLFKAWNEETKKADLQRGIAVDTTGYCHRTPDELLGQFLAAYALVLDPDTMLCAHVRFTQDGEDIFIRAQLGKVRYILPNPESDAHKQYTHLGFFTDDFGERFTKGSTTFRVQIGHPWEYKHELYRDAEQE